MSLPKLPELPYPEHYDYSEGCESPYAALFTEAQVLQLQRDTVEACADLCDTFYATDPQYLAKSMREMLTQGGKDINPRTAMTLALDALQNCANGEDDVLLTRDALAALQAAIDAPSEPVAQVDGSYNAMHIKFLPAGVSMKLGQLLYTNQQVKSEPVAWLSEDAIGERYLSFDKPLDDYSMCPLFTHPPVSAEPLSDEEINNIVREAAKGSATRRDGTTSYRIARAIEAAIRGKK